MSRLGSRKVRAEGGEEPAEHTQPIWSGPCSSSPSAPKCLDVFSLYLQSSPYQYSLPALTQLLQSIRGQVELNVATLKRDEITSLFFLRSLLHST